MRRENIVDLLQPDSIQHLKPLSRRRPRGGRPLLAMRIAQTGVHICGTFAATFRSFWDSGRRFGLARVETAERRLCTSPARSRCFP